MLVSRLTADVQSLTTFVRQVLVEVVGNMLLLVVTLTIVFVLSPILAAVVFVSLPILLISSASYRKRSQPTFLALRDRIADVMTSLQEGLTGVRVVQSFAREREHEAGVPRAELVARARLARRVARQHALLPGDLARAGRRRPRPCS